jgi:3-hydroxyacyl-CoA dehydrogenase/enoyl-CoA hydratase/3-hydroxybutyryl-CoA epimerase
LEVAARVGHVLHQAFGERMAPPPVTAQLREKGREGRKSGRGFYLYEGKRKRVDPSVYGVLGLSERRLHMDKKEMVERVTLQMVNEAIRCLGEGVLRSARDGDVGAIWGLGFPPYTGGPFAYADSLGLRPLLERMRLWEKRLGIRFEPAPLLIDQARREELFQQQK